MLNNKELNEKIKAFFNTKEKSNLRQTEILMKNAFSSDYLMYDVVNFISLIKDDQEFINYIGLENLENKVIKTENADCIYNFAKDIKGANIEKLENAIIATQNVGYIYDFARDVEGANIEKLENAIIETKDAEYIYNFAKNVKGANIEKLENAIIETNDAMYIYQFARDVKGANIEKLENAIIETKNAEYIYLFAKAAKAVKGVNLYKFLNKIKRINLQNSFTDLEMRLETFIISSDLKNIYYVGEKNARAKKQILTELINNRHEGNNEIILGIYFDYLNNPEATIEDLNECDREYLDYMCSLEEVKLSDKKKVKIRKKEKFVLL